MFRLLRGRTRSASEEARELLEVAQDARRRADDARDERRWPEARANYEIYLASYPADAGLWIQLGHACKESGDLHAADRAYFRALSLGGDGADTRLQIGHLEKVRGNLEGARFWYQCAMEADPAFEPARTELQALRGKDAHLEQQMGSLVNAMRALGAEVLRLRQLNEELSAALKEIAAEASRSKISWEDSLREIRNRIDSLEPASSDAHLILSRIYGNFSDLQRSEKPRN